MYQYHQTSPMGESVRPYWFESKGGITSPCLVLGGAFSEAEVQMLRLNALTSVQYVGHVSGHASSDPVHSFVDTSARVVNIARQFDVGILNSKKELIIRAAHWAWNIPDENLVTHEPWQLLSYRKGGHYRRHADNAMLKDGKWVTTIPWRYISAVGFFATEGEHFEGGSLSFPPYRDSMGNEFIYHPRAGDLVLFPSGPQAEHQVNPVTSGIRISAATWFGKPMNAL